MTTKQKRADPAPQTRNPGSVFGIEFSKEQLRRENRTVKPMLDVVLGSLFSVLSASSPDMWVEVLDGLRYANGC